MQAAKAGKIYNGGYNEDVVRTSVLGRRIEIFFDTEIGLPDEHREEIHAIRSAGPDDCVILYINTPGGVLTTTQSIINALHMTQAETVAIIEGQVASAGTMIACSAQSVQVMPHAQFMIHSAAGGMGGELRNVAHAMEFQKDAIERLMRDVYRDFLTEEEFESVFDGRELWLTDDEVVARFKARAEKWNSERKQEQSTD